jgi:DNA modification methylase
MITVATGISVYVGDCRVGMRGMSSGIAQCCITSPPYFGHRAYGIEPVEWPELDYHPMPGLPPIHVSAMKCILGEETTVEAYVAHLLIVFREVRRVLRSDAVMWLNLGDGYAQRGDLKESGLDDKQLIGVPWRVAWALQADGWMLRSDVVWSKPNPMPSPVNDRPTSAHEFLFLFSMGAEYFYDADAIREAHVEAPKVKHGKGAMRGQRALRPTTERGIDDVSRWYNPDGRNVRDVWTVSPDPFKGDHFAVMPSRLVRPCVLSGTSERGCCPSCGSPWTREVERTAMIVREGPSRRATRKAAGEASSSRTACTGTMVAPPTRRTIGWQASCRCPAHKPVPCTVIDPFGGAATTGAVATWFGRIAVLCEAGESFVEEMPRRVREVHRLLKRESGVVLTMEPSDARLDGELPLFKKGNG